MYDLITQTEVPISVNNGSVGGAHKPSISGDKVVFVDNRNGVWNSNDLDIYLYDISTRTETKVITNVARQGHPAIDGNKIVWEDYRNGNSDIYMYDLQPNVAPVVQINSVPVTTFGSATNFDGSGSSDSDGTITNYHWNFGDSVTDDGANVNHIYTSAGTYQVTLTVTDDDGATVSATASVIVNTPPVAVISPIVTVTLGGTTLFDGSASNDSDGTITNYHWDFGDGGSVNSITANHTYSSAGTYQVTLTVTDNNNVTAMATASAVVNAPPISNIAPITIVILGETTSFDRSASYDSDGTISSYEWNFGDGSSGSGATTTHIYASAGTYNVTLVVIDNIGATAFSIATAIVQTPAQAIDDLVDVVEDMNLAQGISNSLDSKLQNVLGALNAENAENREDAINKLEAFINAAQAQSGNQLTTEQANQLIAAANRIIAAIQ